MVIPRFKDLCWIIQSMATQNRGVLRCIPAWHQRWWKFSTTVSVRPLIHALVFSWRAVIRWSMMSGMPLLQSAFQRAVRSMESKADLMSRNATFSDQSNSRCCSDSSRRARMASIVDLPAVKPDCWGQRDWSITGCMRASKNMGEYLARYRQ